MGFPPRVALLLAAASLSLCACQKKVPPDIVTKSLTSAFRHAPVTASAMCGIGVKGVMGAKVTSIKVGEKNVGTAHITGRSWGAKAGEGTRECEGDVEFSYSYKTRKTGRKRTMTTWTLEHLKLIAVQTKGVTFNPVDENVDDDDDDDGDGDKK